MTVRPTRRAAAKTAGLEPRIISLEAGLEPALVLRLAHGTRFEVYRTRHPDGEVEDLVGQFQGRDDEPILGPTAAQFEMEGVTHPERYQFIVDWLAEASNKRELRRIIDAGSGPAILTNLVARRWPRAEVVGIDRSPDMTRLGEQRSEATGISIVCADIRRIAEVQRGPLDAIVSRRMIHRADDLETILERMIGALAPGGILVNYSFRRPETGLDWNAFITAANLRVGHADLYGAYVRAVLNAPTLVDYGNSLARVAERIGVRTVRLLVFPFDVGFVVER